MSAIFKREFKTFFTSPIGYFVLAVLFGFSGFYFFATNMYTGSADLSGVFGGLFTIVLLLVLPVLTMRLFSDEKRQKTDQALLTAPTFAEYERTLAGAELRFHLLREEERFSREHPPARIRSWIHSNCRHSLKLCLRPGWRLMFSLPDHNTFFC